MQSSGGSPPPQQSETRLPLKIIILRRPCFVGATRSSAVTRRQQTSSIEHTIRYMQGRVQFSIFVYSELLINAGVLLFGRTIKYCVTNIRRKFPTSLSTLSYKTPVFPTGSTLQYHKSNTPALIKSLNWTLPCRMYKQQQRAEFLSSSLRVA